MTDTEAAAPVPQRSFAQLKPPQRKSGIGTSSPVLSALEREYQQALGEKKKLQEAEYEWHGFNGFEMAEETYLRRLAQIEGTIKALERSIRIFDPEWSRKRQMAPKVRRSSPKLPKGTFKPAFVEVLQATRDPLTVKEIAALAAQKLGVPMHSYEQQRRIWRQTYAALRSAYDRGYVICLDCHPSKWLSASLTSH